MNFKDQLKIVQSWSKDKKVGFLDRVGRNVPIGIRMILIRDELSDSNKLIAIRLINEFLNEINNIRSLSDNIIESEKDITILSNYVKQIANKNDGLLRSEIAFCLEDSFESLNKQ